jgi:hypothetical protein
VQVEVQQGLALCGSRPGERVQPVVQVGEQRAAVVGRQAGDECLGQGRSVDPLHHDVGAAGVVDEGHWVAEVGRGAQRCGLVLRGAAVAVAPQHQPLGVPEDGGVAAGRNELHAQPAR